MSKYFTYVTVEQTSFLDDNEFRRPENKISETQIGHCPFFLLWPWTCARKMEEEEDEEERSEGMA